MTQFTIGCQKDGLIFVSRIPSSPFTTHSTRAHLPHQFEPACEYLHQSGHTHTDFILRPSPFALLPSTLLSSVFCCFEYIPLVCIYFFCLLFIADVFAIYIFFLLVHSWCAGPIISLYMYNYNKELFHSS